MGTTTPGATQPCTTVAPIAPQSPCATVAPRLYSAEQETAVQRAAVAAGETGAEKHEWALPFVGFFGMCVLAGVATMVYRRRAMRETRQFRAVQPEVDEMENGLMAGTDSDGLIE